MSDQLRLRETLSEVRGRRSRDERGDQTAVQPPREPPITEADVVPRRKEQCNLLRDLRYFRKLNALNRPARYPEDAREHLRPLGILFAIQAALLLWYFARNASSVDLFRAILIAATVPLVSLGVAGFAGYFLIREINHAQPQRRGLGLLCGAVLLALLAVFNFVACMVGGAPEAAGAVTRSGAAPVSLSSLGRVPIEGLLPLMVGIFCALVAMHRAYSADDSYPGYGALDRRYRDASRRFEEAHRRFPKVPYPYPDAKDVWS